MASIKEMGFQFILLLQVLSQFAVSDTLVKFLPGYPGPLPFHLETGYIGVGESEDVQLFYYFVKSERNASVDPLLLWLTGGPGCSSFSGLVFEFGPTKFNVVEYDGSLPTLVLNPYSWTKVASIIFIDLPVGTGFSYARTPLASKASDFTQVHQANHFLRKWLMDHPEFLSNKVFIGGDSYSGMIVPAIVQEVSNENEEGSQPPINLKGYLLGNPKTDSFDYISRIPYAHGMALISDELYESLKRSCGGNYQPVYPSNTECLKHIDEYEKCVSGIETAHILEARCAFVSPKPLEISAKRRYLDDKSSDILSFDPELPTIGCRGAFRIEVETVTYPYLLSLYWANNEKVRRALSIREGSIKTWIRCNYGIDYITEIDSSIPYHLNLSRKGFPSLIYSGDHDMIVPFLGTQAWIRSLNYSIVDDWRPWHLQGQIAGYTRTYSNKMTFATVKGSGHTAPEYTPAECFAIFERWIDGKQL